MYIYIYLLAKKLDYIITSVVSFLTGKQGGGTGEEEHAYFCPIQKRRIRKVSWSYHVWSYHVSIISFLFTFELFYSLCQRKVFLFIIIINLLLSRKDHGAAGVGCMDGPARKCLNPWHYKTEDQEVNFIHRLAYVGCDLEPSNKAIYYLPLDLPTHNSQHHITSD